MAHADDAMMGLTSYTEKQKTECGYDGRMERQVREAPGQKKKQKKMLKMCVRDGDYKRSRMFDAQTSSAPEMIFFFLISPLEQRNRKPSSQGGSKAQGRQRKQKQRPTNGRGESPDLKRC